MTNEKLRPASEKSGFNAPWKLLGIKFECSVCACQYYDRKEAAQCFESHFEPEAPALRPAAEKKLYAAPWKLDGIKFGCCVCEKMFYDRKEATSCFESHFERDA